MSLRYLFSLCLLFCFSLTAKASLLAVCKDAVNVSLPNDDCTVVIDPLDIDGGSYGTGSTPLTYSVWPSGPLAIGEHRVWLYVSEGNSTNACWSTVTVEDKTAPTVSCNSRTYYKVASDHIVPVNIDDLVSRSDNCGIYWGAFSDTDLGTYGSHTYYYEAGDESGNTASCSNAYTIVNGEPQNYCSNNRTSSYEYIRRVYLTGTSMNLERISADDGGYHWEYPSGLHTLYHGFTYQLRYSPGFRYAGSYRLYWRVYLDKNRDGDFTDSGELLHQWNGTGANTFSFASPGTHTGYTRLRVVMSYGNYANSCGSGWGEVEDYSVWMNPFIFFPWPGFGATVSDIPPTVAAVEERPDDPVYAHEYRGPQREQQIEEQPIIELQGADVKLFPNPLRANQPLQIRGASLPNRLIARNALGKTVAETLVPTGHNQWSWSLPGLPAGTYLVSGYDESTNHLWTKRILIQR